MILQRKVAYIMISLRVSGQRGKVMVINAQTLAGANNVDVVNDTPIRLILGKYRLFKRSVIWSLLTAV